MDLSKNYALYYPTIQFQDYTWLWSASLLWDGIYRIVPEGYVDEPVYNVAVLMEGGDIGRPMSPGRYAQGVARDFLKHLRQEKWDAAALGFNSEETEYRLLHREKADVAVRELIVGYEHQDVDSEWLKVPKSFSALYMTYLAKKIAVKNDLQLVTDSLVGYTAERYFAFDGKLSTGGQGNELNHRLAALVLEDYVPENILEIGPENILAFRRIHADERRNFMRAVREAATAINKCEDPLVVEDLLMEVKKDIGRAVREYKKSAGMLNVTGWTGAKALAFPIAAKLGPAVAAIDPALSSLIAYLGIGLGVWYSGSEIKAKQRKLRGDHQFSYLASLQKNFHGLGTLATNLRESVHEFVED